MIRIRKMEAADVAAVSKIEEEVFSMPWSEQDFLEMIEADYAYYLVAEEGDSIVGCCGFRNISGEGEITNVVIKPEYQGKGIGRKLLEKILALAESLGIDACTLEVRVSNQIAIHLYESMGFRGEGIRPDFYEKPREDALIMWKR